MRLPNLVHAAGAVLLATFLSGCTPSDAVAPPEPAPTFVAPYATDEEALAAAEAAYAEYIRVINLTLNESSVDEDLIATVAVGEEFDELIESHTRLSDAGTRSVGAVEVDQVQLQRYSRDGSFHEILVVYACEDLTNIHLLNSDGSRVTDENFGTELVQITFDFSEESRSLLVSDRSPWGEKC